MGMADSDSWYKEGNNKMMKGNNEEAISDYDKAVELNPVHIGAWNNRGIALSRLKNYEGAIKCYDKAIEIDPTHVNAWYNKAKSLRDLAQSLLDKANDDRTAAAKLINQALVLFDSANECYNRGESIATPNK